MAVTISTLSIFAIVLACFACETCCASVVYVKYTRRLPPKFKGDKYVEEVVEEFDTPQRPPWFGHSEHDIKNILRAGAQPGIWPQSPATKRPYQPEWPVYSVTTKLPETHPMWPINTRPSLYTTASPPTTSTTSRSFFDFFDRDKDISTTSPATTTTTATTTTEKALFNWFHRDKNPTTTTTSTTPTPIVFTTNPYENQNPDYSNLIPTITAEVIPPSSTPRVIVEEITTSEKPDDVEYYDNHEESENENDREATTTGPTKVNFPAFTENGLNGKNEEADSPGDPLQGSFTAEATTEAFNGDEDENYDDENYDYEDEKDEDVNGNSPKIEPITEAQISTTEKTKKAGLLSLFG